MIDRFVDAGIPVKKCCRVLGVSSPGYYRYKNRPTSATQLRREWLTGLIREIHVASRGTYGYRRIHAELTMAMNVQVSSPADLSAHDPGGHLRPALAGADQATPWGRHQRGPGQPEVPPHRLAPNELWVTDIAEHPTTWIPAVVATSGI